MGNILNNTNISHDITLPNSKEIMPEFFTGPSDKTGTSEPSTKTGTSEPSTKTGTSEPSTKTGTSEPSIKSGTSEPSTKSGTLEPSTKSGTLEPSTKSGTLQPSTKSGTSEPSTKFGTSEPSTKTGTSEPSTKTGTSEPSIKTGTLEPSTKSGTLEPSTKTGTLESFDKTSISTDKMSTSELSTKTGTSGLVTPPGEEYEEGSLTETVPGSPLVDETFHPDYASEMSPEENLTELQKHLNRGATTPVIPSKFFNPDFSIDSTFSTPSFKTSARPNSPTRTSTKQNILSRFRARCELELQREDRQEVESHCDGTEWSGIVNQEICQGCFICDCEEDCYDYKTCCLNKIVTDHYSSSPQQKQNSIICHSSFLTHHLHPRRFTMVDYCPSSWGSDHVSDKCSKVDVENTTDDRWPMWSPSKGQTYRNVHCGLCHGEERDQLQPWDLTVFCLDRIKVGVMRSFQDALTMVSQFPECALGFNPPTEASSKALTEVQSQTTAAGSSCGCAAEDVYDTYEGLDRARDWTEPGDLVLSVDIAAGDVYHVPSRRTVTFQYVQLQDDEGVVLVCADQLYTTSFRQASSLVLEKFFSSRMIYVSVACQSLSVLGLLLVLLTYCLFPELRTLPGKNTMGLVISLLVTMLLFQLGVSRVEIRALCVALGVAIHYSLLSAFTWMGLCSLHMYRVFAHLLTTLHLRQPHTHSNTFSKYVLLSLHLPACIVGATLLGNFAARGRGGGDGGGGGWEACPNEEALDWGYSQGICYVSNAPSLILASVAPICIAVGMNVVLFLLTVLSLRHLNHDARQATQQQRQQMALYFRLSTLTGINWLAGIAIAVVDTVIVWYIFILLVCNQ
ncbi:hypothetical protein ACOMHN_018247 [Nucella lapillus]